MNELNFSQLQFSDTNCKYASLIIRENVENAYLEFSRNEIQNIFMLYRQIKMYNSVHYQSN